MHSKMSVLKRVNGLVSSLGNSCISVLYTRLMPLFAYYVYDGNLVLQGTAVFFSEHDQLLDCITDPDGTVQAFVINPFAHAKDESHGHLTNAAS